MKPFEQLFEKVKARAAEVQAEIAETSRALCNNPEYHGDIVDTLILEIAINRAVMEEVVDDLTAPPDIVKIAEGHCPHCGRRADS